MKDNRNKNITLVDVDNIFILDNKPSLVALSARIKHIEETHDNIVWFGNEYTSTFMNINDIKIRPFNKSTNHKDATDHKMLKFLKRSQKQYDNVFIVTSDKTLQRLVYFLFHDAPFNLYFQSFTSTSRHKLHKVNDVDICFKTHHALKKFIESYNLMTKRA